MITIPSTSPTQFKPQTTHLQFCCYKMKRLSVEMKSKAFTFINHLLENNIFHVLKYCFDYFCILSQPCYTLLSMQHTKKE